MEVGSGSLQSCLALDCLSGSSVTETRIRAPIDCRRYRWKRDGGGGRADLRLLWTSLGALQPHVAAPRLRLPSKRSREQHLRLVISVIVNTGSGTDDEFEGGGQVGGRGPRGRRA